MKLRCDKCPNKNKKKNEKNGFCLASLSNNPPFGSNPCRAVKTYLHDSEMVVVGFWSEDSTWRVTAYSSKKGSYELKNSHFIKSSNREDVQNLLDEYAKLNNWKTRY